MDNENEVVETQENSTEQETKTFTQEEVDSIVNNRLSRQESKLRQEMRGELESEIRKEIQQEQDEANKLKRMNEEQRRKYEYEKKDKELAELRAKVVRNEMERTATDILSEKGISANSDVLSFVVADTAEQTKANIEKFVKLVDEKSRENRKNDFANSTPKNGGSGENALDKDSFSKMSYSERLHLKDTQPEVYENLIKQMIK